MLCLFLSEFVLYTRTRTPTRSRHLIPMKLYLYTYLFIVVVKQGGHQTEAIWFHIAGISI